MKGRQDAGEIDRVGLRLQIPRQQAQAGDIALLYGDQSEALTHPYLAPTPGRRVARTSGRRSGQCKKVAMLGVLDAVTRELIVHTSTTKREHRLHRLCWRNSTPVSDPGPDERRSRWSW